MATEIVSKVSPYLPFAVTIVVATFGWVFTYVHASYRSRKEARLELVNAKLRLLYGPLYSRLLAGSEAWDAFYNSKWPKHGQSGYFTDGFPLSEEEMATWRHWMTHVFHPLNKRLEATIVEHVDLIEGDDLPKVFTDVLAHIHVYDAVLRSWEKGDFSEHTSIINFPADEMMKAVEPVFFELRDEQKKLSGSAVKTTSLQANKNWK